MGFEYVSKLPTPDEIRAQFPLAPALAAEKAKKDEATYLHCEEGDPVFDIFKIVYDENDVPVHVSISILNGATTSYIISSNNKEQLKIKNPINKKTHILTQ